MTSIADRASAAHRYAERLARHLPAPACTAADIARTTVRLAVLLGIDPEHVRPAWPWQRAARTTRPYPLTLHVTDCAEGAEYVFRYRDPLYPDESFLLLGLCPLCAGPVPCADIRDLAELGTYLARAPLPLPEDGRPPADYPDEFDADPGHGPACPFREPA
ncbi:hypothetical protein [Actinacidiphila oryziradicis]|uniref:Uncharacterized protein n=1 Tax=Actinacidiphila oryziradicis TaxID=2571141 RepID=A0A4U0RZ46_9ACTN|nr:hypothetical protein [Actinacidiphila oryziradicis]TKA00101.1 hypothetical protein FCI23_43515 [Actinacidiphila oryziradicis]